MRVSAALTVLLILSLGIACAFGETPFSLGQYVQAIVQPHSAAAEIVWDLRLPRAIAAALVGAQLGLTGALMQGLLRNPLADPGVLGISAVSAVAAATVIALGLAGAPGAVAMAAMAGALAAGILIAALAARLREPETLILFGVALSAAGGAATALIFNLSPSLITTNEVMNWLLGSAAGRSWPDILAALPASVAGVVLAAYAARGLSMLTLGEETAALSGLPMARVRAAAVAGSALLTGAAVAMVGVIGFVGLAAPHLVRGFADEDPARTLAPSAIAGAVFLVLADLLARLIPTPEELRLGVVTALFGAPAFAVVAWRAGRSWRR